MTNGDWQAAEKAFGYPHKEANMQKGDLESVTGPFRLFSFNKCQFGIEISMDTLIDRYDYHDAPYEVTWYPTKQDLEDLRDAINLILVSTGGSNGDKSITKAEVA